MPSCVFNEKLSSFEAIVKFLKENYGFGFERIADLLGKKRQSVWRAYQSSSKKQKQSLEVTDLYYLVPVQIFRDSKCSLLEELVFFLKECYELTFSEVSALVARDERTVWTAYARARRKKRI